MINIMENDGLYKYIYIVDIVQTISDLNLGLFSFINSDFIVA